MSFIKSAGARWLRRRTTIQGIRQRERGQTGTISLNFLVDAPVERMATLYQRLERIPEWQTDILEVKNVSDPLDHVGASYPLVY
jgi:hypothetical protein